jgi:ABC-2 type transport system ATP-binding protein
VIDATTQFAELEVAKADISIISAALLTTFPIADLTIEDPSLESVITQAFAAGGSS